MDKKIFLLLLVISLVFVSCSSSSSLSAAEDTFLAYINNSGLPYRNESFHLSYSDDVFNTYLLTVELRESKGSDWTEYETEIECSKLGNDWQCENIFRFTLSQRTLQKTETSLSTQTQEIVDAQNSITVQFLDAEVREKDIVFQFNVTNTDTKNHKLVVQFMFDYICGNEKYTGVSPYIGSGGIESSKIFTIDSGTTITRTEYLDYFGGYSLERHKINKDCQNMRIENFRVGSNCFSCGGNDPFIFLDD